MKNKDMKKRILAIILCLVMVAGICGTALAEGLDAGNSTNTEDSTGTDVNTDGNAEDSANDDLDDSDADLEGDADVQEGDGAADSNVDPNADQNVDPNADPNVDPNEDPTENPTVTPDNNAGLEQDALQTPDVKIDTTAGGQTDITETALWEKELPTLTSVYADDLIAVATSQLGCTTDIDSAEFIAQCLAKAEIPEEKFPQEVNATEWITALSDEMVDLYVPATVSTDEYEPWAGDLIFLNTDEEEGADQVGILAKTEDETLTLVLVQDGIVQEVEYETGAEQFVGYGMLPINMVDENGVEDEGAMYEEDESEKSEHVTTHELNTDIPYPYKNPDDYRNNNPSGNDSMMLNKLISETSDPNVFDLTLDAYGTGTQAEVTVTTPMDIVLVLDASGSMSQSDHYITVTGNHDLESFNKMYEGCTFYDYSSNASSTSDQWLKNAIIKEIDQSTGKATYYSYKDRYGQSIPRPNPITYCKDCGKWIKETRQDVVAVREVVNEGEDKYYIQSNYTYEEVDIIALLNAGDLFETNMQATERGLKEFVSMVKAQGEASGVDHRISIVSYGYYYTKQGARISSTNDLITSGLLTSKTFDAGLMLQYRYIYGNSNRSGTVKADYEDDMSNTFMSLNDAGELNKIDRAIWRYQDVAYCSAYTSTHYGMKMARDILNRRANTDRASESDAMVVVFADGAPGNGMNFYQSWANASLDYANEIKAMDVPIYVVGLYDQADASDVGTKENYHPYYNTSNRFFNYLSSNYNVELQDTNNGAYYDYTYGGPTKGVSDAVISATKNNDGKQFFYSARNGEALTQAFNSIATSVENKATTSINLDSTTVMREQISKYFELECGCTGDKHTCVEVYTQTWNGTAFVNEAKVYPGTSQDPDVQDISVTIKDEKTIDVSGFSYKDFPVTTEYDAQGNPIGGSGKKLLLKLKVETEEGFWGGNNVPTNEEPHNGLDQTGTAIYFDKEIVDGAVFPVPEANVPLHVNIEALDKTIYYGGAITADDLLDKITAGYKTTVGDTQGDPDDTIANLEVTLNANGTLSPAEPWMDDYANLNWTEDSTTVKTEVPNKSGSGDGYTFEVVMTPTKAGAENLSGNTNPTNMALAGTAVDATGKTVEDTGYKYILLPEVTFEDSVINFGFIPNDTYYHDTNKVTADGEEVWAVDGNFTAEPVAGDDDPLTYPEVSGEKPALTYTYTIASESKSFVQDTPINVAVTSSNVDGASGDITNVVTFKWLCDVEDKDAYHSADEDVVTPHKGSTSDYEFWIHVQDAYELPSTGGPGIYLYLLAGVVLLMGGSTIVYKRRCKEVLRRR